MLKFFIQIHHREAFSVRQQMKKSGDAIVTCGFDTSTGRCNQRTTAHSDVCVNPKEGRMCTIKDNALRDQLMGDDSSRQKRRSRCVQEESTSPSSRDTVDVKTILQRLESLESELNATAVSTMEQTVATATTATDVTAALMRRLSTLEALASSHSAPAAPPGDVPRPTAHDAATKTPHHRIPRHTGVLDPDATWALLRKVHAQACAYQDANNLERCCAYYLMSAQICHHYITFALGLKLAALPGPHGIVRTLDRDYPIATLNLLLRSAEELQKQLTQKIAGTGCLRADTSNQDRDDGCSMVTTAKESCLLFRDIIGCERTKDRIRDNLISPFQMPLLFDTSSKMFRYKASSSSSSAAAAAAAASASVQAKIERAYLLYGPPGTGKTLFAQAIVHEMRRSSSSTDILFFAPSPAHLKGKYQGESERRIANYFQCAQRMAKKRIDGGRAHQAYSIIFIDEIDSLAGDRSKNLEDTVTASVTMALATQMEGVAEYPNVVVIGATNYPWELDSAILRRFKTKLCVDLPTPEDQVELLKFYLVKYYDALFQDPSDFCASQHTTAESKKTEARLHHTPTEVTAVLEREQCAEMFAKADATITYADKFNVLAPILFNGKSASDATQQLMSFVNAHLVRNKDHAEFSPSNVATLCSRAMQASATYAIQKGRFQKVTYERDNKKPTLTPFAQKVVDQLHDKYASCETWKNLKIWLKDYLVDTHPYRLQSTAPTLLEFPAIAFIKKSAPMTKKRGGDSGGGGTNEHVTVVSVQQLTKACAECADPLKKEKDAKSFLEKIQQLYIDNKKFTTYLPPDYAYDSFHSAATATDITPLHFALYRPAHCLFQGVEHEARMIALGTITDNVFSSSVLSAFFNRNKPVLESKCHTLMVYVRSHWWVAHGIEGGVTSEFGTTETRIACTFDQIATSLLAKFTYTNTPRAKMVKIEDDKTPQKGGKESGDDRSMLPPREDALTSPYAKVILPSLGKEHADKLFSISINDGLETFMKQDDATRASSSVKEVECMTYYQQNKMTEFKQCRKELQTRAARQSE